MPKGGTPFGALLHPFGACQKDGVPRGRNPAQGCPWGQYRGSRTAVRKALCPKLQSKVQTPPGMRLGAVPKKTLAKAWGAVAVAGKYQPTPPGSARGAMPG